MFERDGTDFSQTKKAGGLGRREGTDTQRLLQGCPSEPHSSRFSQMPDAVITVPKEHTTLSGLVGEMGWSSRQLGEKSLTR